MLKKGADLTTFWCEKRCRFDKKKVQIWQVFEQHKKGVDLTKKGADFRTSHNYVLCINFPSSQYNQYISSLIQIRLTEASYVDSVWIVEHKVILSNTILSVILLHVTHVSLHEKKLSEAMGLFAGGQLSEFY